VIINVPKFIKSFRTLLSLNSSSERSKIDVRYEKEERIKFTGDWIFREIFFPSRDKVRLRENKETDKDKFEMERR